MGTYEKDFGPVDKIIALFGVNWGFGNEKLSLPEPPIGFNFSTGKNYLSINGTNKIRGLF